MSNSTSTRPDGEPPAVSEEPTPELLEAHAERLVKDIHHAGEHLVTRLAALEMYGVDSVQLISRDLSTLAHLLAKDALDSVQMLAVDIVEAEALLAKLLQDLDEMVD